MSFFWTSDFYEPEKRLERLFGPLDRLAEKHPDVYVREVLVCGFMRYIIQTDLFTKLKRQIIKERIKSGDEKYKRFKKFLKDDIPDDVHRQIYRENRKRLAELEKKEYMAWAKRNGLSKRLLEEGWKELDFQSDTKDPAQYCYPVEYLKP
ncbi:MAG: hypothetical protein QW751_03130 [Candidatus Aenigmatarchaeota archaeon]